MKLLLATVLAAALIGCGSSPNSFNQTAAEFECHILDKCSGGLAEGQTVASCAQESVVVWEYYEDHCEVYDPELGSTHLGVQQQNLDDCGARPAPNPYLECSFGE